MPRLDAGFLVVKTFARMYRDYAERYHLTRDVYALPRIDRAPDQYFIQYRGIDRDAISALEPEYSKHVANYSLAEVRLGELEEGGQAEEGFVFALDDALEVCDWLGDLRGDYEVIWARIAGSGRNAPAAYNSIGYEPTYFVIDHFISLL